MLKIMRQNTRTIIWCVIVAFGLWGAGTVVSGTQMLSPYAGEVSGKKIKVRDFEKRKKVLKLFLPAEAADLPSTILDVETFKQIALSQEAKRRKFHASDAEVRTAIERVLGGNSFGMDMRGYSQWTKTVLSESPRDFEETLREVILAQKLFEALVKETGVSPIPESATEEEKKTIDDKNKELSAQALINFYSQAKIISYLKAST